MQQCIGHFEEISGTVLKRQDSNEAFAAMIPRFVNQFMKDHKSTIINGDWQLFPDFIYFYSMVQINLQPVTEDNEATLNQVYNTVVRI